MYRGASRKPHSEVTTGAGAWGQKPGLVLASLSAPPWCPLCRPPSALGFMQPRASEGGAPLLGSGVTIPATLQLPNHSRSGSRPTEPSTSSESCGQGGGLLAKPRPQLASIPLTTAPWRTRPRLSALEQGFLRIRGLRERQGCRGPRMGAWGEKQQKREK